MSMFRDLVSRNVVNLPILGLGLLLAGSNLWLARQNGQLRAEAQYYREFRSPRIGLKPPPLRGHNPDGQDVVISYQSGDPTLLLVFSPTCPHCKRNWPVWSRLTQVAKNCRVVYVNVGGDSSASRLEHNLGAAKLVEGLDPQSVLDYSLFQTPLTIYVSAKGQVEQVWSGEIAPADAAMAEKIVGATTF